MSDKLLTTREAARFLRASEASLRRWADAGLLPASRLGHRRARRFKEDDLLRFMGPRQGGPPPAPGGAGWATAGPAASRKMTFCASWGQARAGRRPPSPGCRAPS